MALRLPLFLWPTDPPDYFPPTRQALPDGLVAVGGDLRPERLLAAYRRGIFPWFSDGDPPLWWSPDPRCVVFPERVHVSRSMERVLQNPPFEFRVNTACEAVIRACQQAPRPGQDGTWITDDVLTAYLRLHRLGHVHSAEAWQNGELVGGMYGVRLGRVFFGESMFHRATNASKFVFISWVRQLQAEGVALLDCQVENPHLRTLGAELIPRVTFENLLTELI